MTEHHLKETHADRCFDDDLYAVLDQALAEALYAPPVEDSEFAEDITGHIEAAREELRTAMELRRAELAGRVISELEDATGAE